MIQLVKMIFFYLSEGMENCKNQGDIREKSGNFEVNDWWQPCFLSASVSDEADEEIL